MAYPTENFLILYRECAQAIHDYLNIKGHERNIKKNLKVILNKKNISWLGCNLHKLNISEYFITLIIRLQCHNWCNIINKILEGKLEEKYINKMSDMQIMAFNKYKKHKLRTSKINK